MNIVFMGTPSFAVPSLQKLIASHHKISAVVTAPDKPRGRGLKLSESDIKKLASSSGLKILQPQSLKSADFIEEIKKNSPDLIVVVAFRILPEKVFTIPSFGSINLHASLLPKYRGAAPINWAIIKGERETGVTTFFLKEKVDTGNVILQKTCEISDDENAGSLHDKLAQLGAEAVLLTVDLIENSRGNVEGHLQDESKATPAPKITPELCRINWNDTVRDVHNFIRGLSPYPGAHTVHNDKTVKIFKSSLTAPALSLGERGSGVKPGKPGDIHIVNGKFYVCCSDGLLEVLELQLEGRKRLTAEEFLRGYSFNEIDRFS